MFDSFQGLIIRDVVQILVLAAVFYYVFLFFRGTRGAQILAGFIVALAGATVLARFANLDALHWILQKFSLFLGVALLVIFQPEIRRALAEIGKRPVFSVSAEKKTVINAIVEATSQLSENRIGALIAIERKIGTGSVQETGVKLDAKVVPELLASVFYPHTPLHDGGVIINGNQIVAAGCIFPLSQNLELHKRVGTRHRAAVGMSEETDAVVVVVSEETGVISVCYRGRLSQGLDEERLRRFLSALLLKEDMPDGPWKRAQEQVNLSPESTPGHGSGTE